MEHADPADHPGGQTSAILTPPLPIPLSLPPTSSFPHSDAPFKTSLNPVDFITSLLPYLHCHCLSYAFVVPLQRVRVWNTAPFFIVICIRPFQNTVFVIEKSSNSISFAFWIWVKKSGTYLYESLIHQTLSKYYLLWPHENSTRLGQLSTPISQMRTTRSGYLPQFTMQAGDRGQIQAQVWLLNLGSAFHILRRTLKPWKGAQTRQMWW